MKNRLDRLTLSNLLSQVQALGPVGETKWNHEDCPAGTDTRKRLYAKVTDDGKLLLAHCFNCGGSGAIKYGRHLLLKPVIEKKPKSEPATTSLGSLYEIISREYEMAISLSKDDWPWKYFDFEHEALCGFIKAKCFGIRKNPEMYILPRGEPPNIIGYDLRFYPVKDFRRIIHPDHANESKLLVYNQSNSRTGVIVEDPISAMRLSIAGFAGISLCTNNMGQEDAWKVSIMYDKLVVWLDNDAEAIKANATAIYNRLKLYNDDVGINLDDSDPKNYTSEYLRAKVHQSLEENNKLKRS